MRNVRTPQVKVMSTIAVSISPKLLQIDFNIGGSGKAAVYCRGGQDEAPKAVR